MDTRNNIGNMTDTQLQKNGWNEWAKYVLMSLEELKKQNSDQEGKIEVNREAFIQAVNSLEILITREMGEVKTDVKILKKQMAWRSVAWSSIIPALAAVIFMLFKMIGIGG